MKPFSYYPDALSIVEELIKAGEKEGIAKVQARLFINLIEAKFVELTKTVSTKNDVAEIKNEIKDAKNENTAYIERVKIETMAYIEKVKSETMAHTERVKNETMAYIEKVRVDTKSEIEKLDKKIEMYHLETTSHIERVKNETMAYIERLDKKNEINFEKSNLIHLKSLIAIGIATITTLGGFMYFLFKLFIKN